MIAGFLERPEEKRERAAVRMRSSASTRPLHVGVGVLQRAVQRRQRLRVAADSERGRRRRPNPPVLIGKHIDQAPENILASDFRQRQHSGTPDLDIGVVRAPKQNIADIRLPDFSQRLDHRDAHGRVIGLEMAHQRLDRARLAYSPIACAAAVRIHTSLSPERADQRPDPLSGRSRLTRVDRRRPHAGRLMARRAPAGPQRLAELAHQRDSLLADRRSCPSRQQQCRDILALNVDVDRQRVELDGTERDRSSRRIFVAPRL